MHEPWTDIETQIYFIYKLIINGLIINYIFAKLVRNINKQVFIFVEFF